MEHRPPGPRGLPAHYLDTGYFSGGGALRPELLTDWAEQIAQGVAQGPAEPITQQLRLARNHVKRAVAALKYGRKPIGQVLNEIQRLKPFAAERAARRRLSDTFRQFVDANVERVTDEKSLLAFAEHFEAVAAYADGLLHSRRAGPTGPATQKERR